MNPQFALEGTYVPDNLIAGEKEIVTKEVTIKLGAALVRGSVLGEMVNDTVAAPVADAGNTGAGVFLAAPTLGKDAVPGTYTVLITVAAAGAGTFIVIDPNGDVVGPPGTVGAAYVSTHLNFTLADGAPDFVVGDKFTCVVSGSGKYKLAAAAAVDGSQNPVAILAQDTDAAAADKKAVAFLTGEFAEEKLTFGVAHTAATVREPLRKLGIYLKSTVAA